jgi:hypothetical protein
VEASDTSVKINFFITDSANRGDTWVGIYQRHGDELKWCGGYSGQGCARPTTFATRPGDGYFLRTLKRDRD